MVNAERDPLAIREHVLYGIFYQNKERKYALRTLGELLH